MMRRSALALAGIAGLLASGPMSYPYYNVPAKAPRPAPRGRANWLHPHSSKRQGERLARQKAKGILDFSASEKCIAAIKARQV